MTRAFSTLVGAALAGGLVWVAAQLSRGTTGGYWAVIGILAGAGLALALARLPDLGVRTIVPSLPTFVFAFLPALVATAWVVVATQPHGNTWRRHVLGWSSDIGVLGVVRDLGPYAIVLALGLGALLGLVFERRAVEDVVAPAVAPAATPVDEPGPVTEPVVVDEPDETFVANRDRELVRR
jgi:hypothetical protein